MTERTLKVMNETGLHARPAAALVNFVKNYSGSVEVACNGKTGNLKSIISIMCMGMKKGMDLKLIVNGENEEMFADDVAKFIEGLKG